MSALRRIVQRHASRPSRAGADKAGFDRGAMQRELARLRRSREVAFWILFVLFGSLFLGAMLAAVHYRSDQAALKGIFAATGITITGVLASMVRLWAQKVRTDLVIAIVMGMPEEPAIAVLNTLINRL